MPLIFDAARNEFRKLEKPMQRGRFPLDAGGGGETMNINLHIERLVLDGLSSRPMPTGRAASRDGSRTDPAAFQSVA